MKSNKGQALVEFVIIIPIMIFIIMAIIDFGNITFSKLKLENSLNDIVELYNDQKFEEINKLSNNQNFSFSYVTNNNTTTITLKRNIKIFTPFLNLVLSDNYLLETKRVIYVK